jgi:hypothetical protein
VVEDSVSEILLLTDRGLDDLKKIDQLVFYARQSKAHSYSDLSMPKSGISKEI